VVTPVEGRLLGRSGVPVSPVGLGGFEVGPQPGEDPNVDRAVAVITAALESGMSWLDTSENYLETRNESLLGEALARVGSEVTLASKVAPGSGVTGGGSGFRHDQVHAACRASLSRLGRDHLDIYFLHWPDDSGVPLDETWGAMAELADQGLVRAIGMSNYALADVERCHSQRSVDVVQVGLSLIDYLDSRAEIERCGELGIAVTVFDVLGSGILTGKTMDEVLATWTGPWVESGFYKRLLAPGKAERSFAVADGVRPIAAELGANEAQVAIAWVLHQPGVTAALAGSRSTQHTQGNALAATLDLHDALERVENLIPLGPAFAD
jgi:aryl-alcohol dehydrogenase-like predicted oxidoreductase